MNIRNVKFGGLTYVSLALYTSSIGLGLMGRNRINFSSDFTYNKYHFAIAAQLVTGAGLMLTSKLRPAVAGPFTQKACTALFASTIINLCLPSFYEGIQDMRNEPFEGSTQTQRRIGMYCLIAGYTLLWLKY